MTITSWSGVLERMDTVTKPLFLFLYLLWVDTMGEIEVELDGREVQVQCPACDGDGTIVYMNGAVECYICGGDGRIKAPAYGTITVQLDPPSKNEGYL